MFHLFIFLFVSCFTFPCVDSINPGMWGLKRKNCASLDNFSIVYCKINGT